MARVVRIADRAFDLVVMRFQPRDVLRVSQDLLDPCEEHAGVLALRIERVEERPGIVVVRIEGVADRGQGGLLPPAAFTAFLPFCVRRA